VRRGEAILTGRSLSGSGRPGPAVLRWTTSRDRPTPASAGVVVGCFSAARPLEVLPAREASGIPAWGEIFDDTTVATAILDRLLHHSAVLGRTPTSLSTLTPESADQCQAV
jgi:hypothetical protein